MKRVILAVVAMSSLAYAGDKEKADTLFKQGKKLMAEKKYSDACEAFEQSMKLDPGIGTELNIARCYEEWGKVGRAWHAYKAAEKMAKDAGDSRADKIDGLLNHLPYLFSLRILRTFDNRYLRFHRLFSIEQISPWHLANPTCTIPIL